MDPISAAFPPVSGLHPALFAPDSPPFPPSAAVPACKSVRKGVHFNLPPPVPAWWNPRQTVCDEVTSPPRHFSVETSGGTPVADCGLRYN